VDEAEQAWGALPLPWQAAFEEAWTSWRHGSLAVGAVVTDGEGTVVARGHNQLYHSGPGPLSSTYMAHAEMNALAQLPVDRGPEYSIYTTFEPCYMCASTMLFYRIKRVHFAIPDPVWRGMHEWFRSSPWASRNESTRECLGGQLGILGYMLHTSRLAPIAPSHVITAHQGGAGPLFALATSHRLMNALSDLGAGECAATAADVVKTLWGDLTGILNETTATSFDL
jgi:tRNA(Arg) A34 adenosine deaminase TadA